ncbi:MAG: SDR family NAD(P)-dependent oxidoreductase, partial [Eubacteriales bacterium]|nr:SDR family NAD(P)-dependent oxidoreductase [Eubacteriales bacterium]
TYFTEALANEVKKSNLPLQIGKITPGIMITNFINHNLGDQTFELSEQTKKVYNILGDYPETIAAFMVKHIDRNSKNNVKFTWLTKGRSFARFLKAPFNKRDFFKDENK